MLQTKLTAAGITDVTVSVKAGASDNHSSYNHVGVSDDGTLEYKWNNNGVTTSSSGKALPHKDINRIPFMSKARGHQKIW